MLRPHSWGDLVTVGSAMGPIYLVMGLVPSTAHAETVYRTQHTLVALARCIKGGSGAQACGSWERW